MKKRSIILTFLATVLPLILPYQAVLALEESPPPEAEEEVYAPPLHFYAVNAGYKDDNSVQNYDFIALEKTIPDALELGSFRIIYTNSSGKEAGGISFTENLVLTSDQLVLGASISPQYSERAGTYYVYDFGSSGLASTAGMLQLYQGAEVIDEVCWGKLTCANNLGKFATKMEDNNSYVRSESGFTAEKYYPEIAEVIVDAAPEIDVPTCAGVVFSEILSNYTEAPTEQFVELYNPTPSDIMLDACSLRYKNKDYPLTGNLRSGMYYVYKNTELTFAKDPATSGELALVDSKGESVATLSYPHGQKKGTSYALLNIGTTKEIWQQTYLPTPGTANKYQKYRTCPEGKVINKTTGNCINKPVAKTVTACKTGYYRNPETNRCRKIASTTSGPTPCKEGYERNPETNRCRKIRENTGDAYAPAATESTDATYENPKIFTATTALVCALVAAVAYAAFQFRAELKKLFAKIFHRKSKV